MGLQTYLTCPAVLGFWLQQVHDEVFRVLGDILPVPLVEHYLSVAALVDQVLEVLRAEWGVTAQKGICDDAHRPHVDGLSVALLQHNFRGGVAERAGHCGEDFVLGVEHLRNAEIGQDQVGVGRLAEVQQVFGLEI